MPPRIAIAGNPNAGKTSVFNELTGAAQTVSNYPGVTVERKEGIARRNGRAVTVVDLPGTYSLTAYSMEEIVARNFIVEDRPDVVVDIVDASNLERNLYLAVQIMEMRVPMVIALNMVDVARNKGYQVDTAALSKRLGVPVVATRANRGAGVGELLDACLQVIDSPRNAVPHAVTYGHGVDEHLAPLTAAIQAVPAVAERYHPRWVAVKLVERDEEVAQTVTALAGVRAEEITKAAETAIAAIEFHWNEDASTIIAEGRYGFASGAVKECVTLSGPARQNLTDQIDAIVCSKTLGPLIMVAVVATLFFWVFKVSDEWAWVPWFGGWVSPTGFMESVFEGLSALIAPLEARMPLLHSLIDDAIIGGVGGVMGFLPLIFTMFLFVSALEDTGYIARLAFLLDRVLQTFGLQGKSILAMIVSGGLGAGGCAVPGVMATRTLREEKDRLVTMLVAPFMNCGAKMPVYAMLIAAFFPNDRTRIMLVMWALSWVLALGAAWALRRFVIRGEQTPFVMELPPYHMPVPRSVLLHTWERTWLYVKKAGTIILAINIVLWALMSFPRSVQQTDGPAAEREALAHSFAGRCGQALEPVTRYAGFDWQVNIALIGGFAAKEVVVGTLGTVYSMTDVADDDFDSLSERLAGDPEWSPLRAFVMMLFVMIYAPCFATVAVIWRESGSWKWALFATAYSTTIALVIASAVYQAGQWLNIGVS